MKPPSVFVDYTRAGPLRYLVRIMAAHETSSVVVAEYGEHEKRAAEMHARRVKQVLAKVKRQELEELREPPLTEAELLGAASRLLDSGATQAWLCSYFETRRSVLADRKKK